MRMKEVLSLCRMCVQESRFFKSIFEQYFHRCPLYEIINELCQLDICFGDGLPDYICFNCHSKLLEFQDFKKASHESKAALLKMKMSANEVEIKTEVFDDGATSSTLKSSYCEGDTDNVCLSQSETSRSINGGTFSHKDSSEYGEVCHDEVDIDEFGLSHLKSESIECADKELPSENGSTNIHGFTMTVQSNIYVNSCAVMQQTKGKHEPYVPWKQSFSEGTMTNQMSRNEATGGVGIPGEEESLECRWCTKKFKSKAAHTRHIEKHGGKEKFSCSICGKQFKYYYSLKPHLRIHTSERRFECSFCHKRFLRNEHLVSHLRNHTGETPFKCSLCGRAFKFNSSFKYHCKNRCQIE